MARKGKKKKQKAITQTTTRTKAHNDRVRMLASTLFFALFAYLVLAVESDRIVPLLGLDRIAGTVEDNLAGQIGALLAYAIKFTWGALYFVVPGLCLYLAIALFRKEHPKHVVRMVSTGAAVTTFLATVLSGISIIALGQGRTIGWGGFVGDRVYTGLSQPLGSVGALIVSGFLGLAIAITQLDHRKVEAAVLESVRIARRVVLWLWRTLVLTPPRAIAAVTRGVTRRFALAASSYRQSKSENDVEAVVPESYTPAEVASVNPVAPRSEIRSENIARSDALPKKQTDKQIKPAPQAAPPAHQSRAEVLKKESVTPQEATKDAGSSKAVARPSSAPWPGGEWSPPSDLFALGSAEGESEEDKRQTEELGTQLIEAIREFRIEAELVGYTCGPTVVCFHLDLASGIKISKLAALEADLSVKLRQPSVRVAPLPQSGAVSVELARPTPRMVGFREMYESSAFRNPKLTLPLALGVDLAGKPIVSDLVKMPHLLVAGATGSGKSVALNTLLTSMVARYSPEDLRLILADPKRVEMALYQPLPHLRHPVIYDAEEVSLALRWAVLEMERRYGILAEWRVRNLADYEKKRRTWQPPKDDSEAEAPEKLPYICIVIDELADLMITDQAAIETPLIQLAQKSRAVGIHLILATQRPTVEVITGLLKANIPARMAFRVAQRNDSRTILDQNGADRLLGNGDMLFLPPGQSDLVRIQGAFISTEETEQFVDWCAEQYPNLEEQDEDDILSIARKAEAESAGGGGEYGVPAEERDDKFMAALEVCIANDGGSTSLLQRKLGIGYGRAARIIDQLVDAGYLGESSGNKPRPVLVSMEDLQNI